jgi:hypothetical protein
LEQVRGGYRLPDRSFNPVGSSAQSLLLGLLEQRGSLVVQLLDALDRCFVGHLI